jgi:hypothetical protein
LVLRDGDRVELERWTRASTVSAGAAKRARIVLLAAEGVANARITELVGVSLPTVMLWRGRYPAQGIAGLADVRRPGRPRVIDQATIVTATLTPPPKKLGVTHWSTRLLAKRLGLSDYTIAKAWRDYGIKPWRAESFRFSTDPELIGKVTDVCGLYLAPPENAIVLCVDEKSQIQALDRTIPVLPMQPGLVERRSHDYVRHGTTTRHWPSWRRARAGSSPTESPANTTCSSPSTAPCWSTGRTARLAPAERDWRTLVERGLPANGPDGSLDPAMLELFDLEWRLDEISQYAACSPHRTSATPATGSLWAACCTS